MGNSKQSLLRTIFGMMVNPSGTLKNSVFSTKWYLSAVISALAFGLFFMQTGLDLYKTGQKGADFVLLSAGVGAVYGLIVIPAVALFVWIVLKLSKSDKNITWAVSSFCLSYSGALIYGISGLIFSLALGWKTSVAFGVTGVLWATGPMIIAIRDMTQGKNVLSVPISTFVSAFVLFSWSLYGSKL